jgi:hypothetical protein
MENELEIIKENLPLGYLKTIADEIGCSIGTVHNTLNSKTATRRYRFKNQIIEAAIRMCDKNLETKKKIETTTQNLRNTMQYDKFSG